MGEHFKLAHVEKEEKSLKMRNRIWAIEIPGETHLQSHLTTKGKSLLW